MPPQPISAMGIRSATISNSWGDEPAAVGERARGDVEEGVAAAQEALQLVDHEAEEAWPTGSGDTRDVRTHEHIGELPNRTRRGNRLGIEDVDRHADVTSTRTRDQADRPAGQLAQPVARVFGGSVELVTGDESSKLFARIAQPDQHQPEGPFGNRQ